MGGDGPIFAAEIQCQIRRYGVKTEILFNHLVGCSEQRRGHRDSERFGGLEVDDKIEFRRPKYQQVGRFRTLGECGPTPA